MYMHDVHDKMVMVPHFPPSWWQAFQWWLGGFGFFFGLLGLVSLTDPAGRNPVVRLCPRRLTGMPVCLSCPLLVGLPEWLTVLSDRLL